MRTIRMRMRTRTVVRVSRVIRLRSNEGGLMVLYLFIIVFWFLVVWL
jgi:hypothetical protein